VVGETLEQSTPLVSCGKACLNVVGIWIEQLELSKLPLSIFGSSCSCSCSTHSRYRRMCCAAQRSRLPMFAYKDQLLTVRSSW